MLFVERGNILFLFYLYIEMRWVGSFFFFFSFGNLPFEGICYLFPANIAECLSLFPFPALSFSFVLVIFFLSFFLLTFLVFLCILFILLIPLRFSSLSAFPSFLSNIFLLGRRYRVAFFFSDRCLFFFLPLLLFFSFLFLSCIISENLVKRESPHLLLTGIYSEERSKIERLHKKITALSI